MAKKKKVPGRTNDSDLVYSTGPDGPQAIGKGAAYLPPEGVASTRDLPPEEQTLRVTSTNKGRRGKTVTEVTGFRLTASTLKELGKAIKQHCGSGGSVQGATVIVQGDHATRAREFLERRGFIIKA